MRQVIPAQVPLGCGFVSHRFGHELKRMDALLSQLPATVFQAVHGDLCRNLRHPGRGRPGLSANTVARVIVAKQWLGLPFRRLAFTLQDSQSIRAFCHLEFGQAPSGSALQRSCKLISAKTLESLNQALVRLAGKLGQESGEVIRVDCTATKSNIHAPTDSSLICDCVRVLIRLMKRGRNACPGIYVTNNVVACKRRNIEILNISPSRTSKVRRRKAYQRMLRILNRTMKQATRAIARLEPIAPDLSEELTHYLALARRVFSQTQRRVINGEKVSADDKVFSIFEEHTDIIIKDNRETTYGHKLCLAGGKSGLVTDVVIEDGNPNDSTLTVRTVQRHTRIFGTAPKQVALDGGFASKENLNTLKQLGVTDVCFSKGRGLTVEMMASSPQVYRKLRNFRSGIEMVISFLKRRYALRRVNWKGWESFKAYTWASVLAANLATLARLPSG